MKAVSPIIPFLPSATIMEDLAEGTTLHMPKTMEIGTSSMIVLSEVSLKTVSRVQELTCCFIEEILREENDFSISPEFREFYLIYL